MKETKAFAEIKLKKGRQSQNYEVLMKILAKDQTEYIIYQEKDNTEEPVKIFASKLSTDGQSYLPLESDREWKTIESILAVILRKNKEEVQ